MGLFAKVEPTSVTVFEVHEEGCGKFQVVLTPSIFGPERDTDGAYSGGGRVPQCCTGCDSWAERDQCGSSCLRSTLDQINLQLRPFGLGLTYGIGKFICQIDGCSFAEWLVAPCFCPHLCHERPKVL